MSMVSVQLLSSSVTATNQKSTLFLHEQEASETVRAAVATLLSQLMAQPLHGPRVTLLLSRLLPPGLVAAIQVSSDRSKQGVLDCCHEKTPW